MKNQYYFLLFFFLFFHFSIFCMDRELIILMDWKERINLNGTLHESDYDFSVMSDEVINALETAENPILITTSLWKNISLRAMIFKDLINLNLDRLKEKYGKYSLFKDLKKFIKLSKKILNHDIDPMHVIIKSFFMCYHTLTKTMNNWKLHKTNNQNFYLLIPQNYLENKRKILENFKFPSKLLKNDTFVLGLKIKENIKILPEDITQINLPEKKEDEFIKFLPNLFVTSDDIKKMINDREEHLNLHMHKWYFYNSGHGDPHTDPIEKIVGLSPETFRKMLLFFKNNINTKLYYYNTCFIGGRHLILPYKGFDFKEELFNYIIIGSSLNYYPTLPKEHIKIEETNETEYLVRPSQNFQAFFENIKKWVNFFIPHKSQMSQEKRQVLTQALKQSEKFLLDAIKNVQVVFEKKVPQIPVIRFPGTEWFSAIDVDKKVFIITRVMANVKEREQKPIIINNKKVVVFNLEPFSSIKEDNRTITKINTSIIIKNANELKAILSASPFDATYYIQKLEVDIGLMDLLKIFFKKVTNLGRTFYIKTLVCKNDLDENDAKIIDAIGLDVLELKDVILTINDKHPLIQKYSTIPFNKFGIAFIYNGKDFVRDFDQYGQPISDTKLLPTGTIFQYKSNGPV